MQSILIVRLSAIGDVVMASPVIAAIKRTYPQARLVWVVQPECAPLLQHHPGLDAVVVWPRKQWQELWRTRQWRQLRQAIAAFRLQLRWYRFDLAIDLQGLLKSGLITYLSGAKRRVGLGSREGSQYLMHRVIERDGGDARRIGSEYLFAMQQLGMDTDEFAMELVASVEAQEKAKTRIQYEVGPAPFAVICPFTTRPQKHWSESHWPLLARKLTDMLGLKVVMLGGPGDTEAARRIAAGNDIINLVGETGLPEASEVIRQAAAVIGVDTGLTHMGHAHQRPTVALFGSTCPYTDAASELSRVIYHDLPCAPCKRKPTCHGAFTCMTGISPDEVITTLKPLLEQQARRLQFS